MRYSPVFLLGLFVISLAVARAEFRAAVVKVDITPTTPQWLMGYGPRQSTGVRDKIYHRISREVQTDPDPPGRQERRGVAVGLWG